MNARTSQVVKVACPHDCPDTCGMLVTVQDGVATKIQGDPTMPFTEGTLCTKVAHYLERTYSPDRLVYPQKRVGKKGEGKFKRISWDEALDEIAARLKVLEPETILPCSYAGTMGMVQYMSMDRRFFNKLGASQLDRTLCSSAGKAGHQGDPRRLGGHGPGALRRGEADHPLGREPDRFQPAPVVARAGRRSGAARR
jgi:anaerobic selenocysteine-containing dehydrogenase